MERCLAPYNIVREVKESVILETFEAIFTADLNQILWYN